MTIPLVTQPETRERPDHLPNLDGLRGIAVLLVLFGHSNIQLTGLPFTDAAFGVSVFFALSGFLISRIVLASAKSPKPLRIFWLKRIARLAPVLVVFVLLQSLFKGWGEEVVWWMMPIYNWQKAYTENPTGPVGYSHLWTLCVEEQFYIIWPLVLLLVKRRWLFILTCALIIASIVQAIRMPVLYPDTASQRIYFGTDTQAIVLLAGSFLAQCEKWFRESNRLVVTGLLLLVLSVLVLRIQEHAALLEHLSKSAAAISMLMIAIGTKHAGIDGILSDSRLCWIGRISYGLYVYHLLLFRPSPSNLPLWVLAWLGVFLGSWLSYTCIEKPIMHKARSYMTTHVLRKNMAKES